METQIITYNGNLSDDLFFGSSACKRLEATTIGVPICGIPTEVFMAFVLSESKSINHSKARQHTILAGNPIPLSLWIFRSCSLLLWASRKSEEHFIRGKRKQDDHSHRFWQMMDLLPFIGLTRNSFARLEQFLHTLVGVSKDDEMNIGTIGRYVEKRILTVKLIYGMPNFASVLSRWYQMYRNALN